MFNWFRKKETEQIVQPVEQKEQKQEQKFEIDRPLDQKIELLAAQIEAMGERIKNIERMVEEIYKIAKT